MLDNLNGSSESELVQKLQAARSSEEQESAPNELTDETGGEEPQAEVAEEAAVEAGDPEHIEATEEVEEQEIFTIKAAGEEQNVSFDELVEGYQKGQDYYKKTTGLADERKEFEASKAQELETLNTEKQKYNELISQLESVVNKQENSAEYWEELRDSDPSEYLRQKEELEANKSTVEKAKAEKAQEDQANRKQLVSTHAEMLMKSIGSEWADEQVKAKDLEGMYKYVYGKGLAPEEASNIFDYRFWLMARDAMKYQELQKTGEAVKKQVRKAPKTVKSKQSVRVPDQEVKDIKKRVRSSGGKSESDLVALMQAKRNR